MTFRFGSRLLSSLRRSLLLGLLLTACARQGTPTPAPCESPSQRQPVASVAPSGAEPKLPPAPELSSYTTTVKGSPNRHANIRMAASRLDGKVLAPRAKFSFNETVGPRTKEAGFLSAPEFVAGAKVEGEGGGVCQVSSTLYVAARQGWLTVLTRHSHSRPVSYMTQGMDAAVAYPDIDLVLQNPYPEPLTVKARVEGNLLRIAFEGRAPDFSVEHRYTSHFPEDYPIREIPSRFVTTERLYQAGRPGMSGTSVWIKRAMDGSQLDKVVSISRYQPIPEIMIVPVSPRTTAVYKGGELAPL